MDVEGDVLDESAVVVTASAEVVLNVGWTVMANAWAVKDTTSSVGRRIDSVEPDGGLGNKVFVRWISEEKVAEDIRVEKEVAGSPMEFGIIVGLVKGSDSEGEVKGARSGFVAARWRLLVLWGVNFRDAEVLRRSALSDSSGEEVGD